MNAELAYLFRHALLRDAAYQLQLPGGRTRLHGLAFEAIEAMAGGRPAELSPLGEAAPAPFREHATDAFAEDLARHAHIAQAWVAKWPNAAKLYLRRAAELAQIGYQSALAVRCWRELAELSTGKERGEALLCAGIIALRSGKNDVAETLLVRSANCFREAMDQLREGVALTELAAAYARQARFGKCERTCETASALFLQVGDR